MNTALTPRQSNALIARFNRLTEKLMELEEDHAEIMALAEASDPMNWKQRRALLNAADRLNKEITAVTAERAKIER